MNVLACGLGKTGTTVIAKTIQHSLPGAGFLMEPKSEEEITRRQERPLVVKILWGQWQQNLPALEKILRRQSGARFDRIVTILRDPRDQAISSLLYNFYNLAGKGRASPEQLRELIDLVRAKEQKPSAISFTRLCEEVNRVMRWRGYSGAKLLEASETYWQFLCSLGEISGFRLRYEDFMQGELGPLESYLGVPLTSRREVDEFQRTRRSAAAGNWREFFTPEDVAVLQPLTGESLAEIGYCDWELRPVEALNPAHLSEYLLRLQQEAQSKEKPDKLSS